MVGHELELPLQIVQLESMKRGGIKIVVPCSFQDRPQSLKLVHLLLFLQVWSEKFVVGSF